MSNKNLDDIDKKAVQEYNNTLLVTLKDGAIEGAKFDKKGQSFWFPGKESVKECLAIIEILEIEEVEIQWVNVEDLN